MNKRSGRKNSPKHLLILCIFFLGVFSSSLGFSRDVDEVSVSMTEYPQRTYKLEGSFESSASPRTVWEVLTDYNHIGDFVPSIGKSKVQERKKNFLILEQAAVGSFFIFKEKVHVLLEVREEPLSQISFEDVSHQDFDLYAGLWRLTRKSGRMQVDYDLTVKPRLSTPSFLARKALIKAARSLLKEVQSEIARREIKKTNL